MAETIDQLMISLGLETDEQSFSDAQASFDQLTSKALQFGATIGAGLGLNELTFGFSQAVDQIKNLAEEFEGFGVTPQLISNMQTVLELIGQEGSDAEGIIRNLASLVEDTDWGQIAEMGLAKGLEIQGIQEAETATEAMAALNEQLSQMDQETARRVAGEIGIGQAGLEFLRQPNLGERMGQAEEMNPLTDAQVEAARDFQDGFAKLENSMDGLSRAISETFVGDLGETMGDLAEWLQDNREEISDFADAAMPYLKTAAIGITTLVALRTSKAVLGGLSKLPFLQAGVAGVIGEGAMTLMNPDAEEDTERMQTNRQWRQATGMAGPEMSLEEAQKWLDERGGTIRGDAGGDMGKIPIIERPDEPEEPGFMDRLMDQLRQSPTSGDVGPSPVSQTIQIDVDARQSTDPEQTRRATEQGVSDAIARASENALIDIRTNVS